MHSKKIIIGYSLIELMIALVLATIILSLLYSVLLFSLKIFSYQTRMVHLQENACVITRLLMRELSNSKISIYYSEDIKLDTEALTSYKNEKTIHYFISKTERFNNDRSPVYAFFKKEEGHHKEELIDNVYQMKINYDILKNNKIEEVDSLSLEELDHIRGLSIYYELRDYDSNPRQTKKGFIYVAL